MTDLIESQLKIIGTMVYCGITTGLVVDTFRLFARRFFPKKRIAKAILVLVCSVVIAFLIGEFGFYCQNGKLTFAGGVCFVAGLLLWKRYFYDIILQDNSNSS
jgi:hypothetical protein